MTEVPCPHCDGEYKKKGLNVHIGRIHPLKPRANVDKILAEIKEDREQQSSPDKTTTESFFDGDEIGSKEDESSLKVYYTEGDRSTLWDKLKNIFRR